LNKHVLLFFKKIHRIMGSHDVKNESNNEQLYNPKIKSLPRKTSSQAKFETHKDQQNPSKMTKSNRHVL